MLLHDENLVLFFSVGTGVSSIRPFIDESLQRRPKALLNTQSSIEQLCTRATQGAGSAATSLVGLRPS